jgi:peptide/nickel transport system substrate-binding protein
MQAGASTRRWNRESFGMMRRVLMAAAAALVLGGALPAAAQAQTVRWSAAADANTLDPHSQNIGSVALLLQQVYDPLISRNADLSIRPALALSWTEVSPTQWRFVLRQGVRFHEGQAFSADDVVFSIERALAPTSNYGIFVDTVERAVKVDDFTVDIFLKLADPILPNKLASIYIMSKPWSEANNATRPQNTRAREEMHTVRNMNGTGAFRLISREQDVRTVMRRNPDWFGWREEGSTNANIQELVFRPIASDATRVAGLLSGEVDFLLDPPLQDLNRLRNAPSIKVLEGPEVRTIFIAMDVFRDELLYSDVRGRNPLKDVRVRRALYHAIDIQAINRTTMRGFSVPTGTFFPPQVNGYAASEDVRLPYDQARARALLAEAGYPNGFGITLDCPNNRYIAAPGAVLPADPARRHQRVPAGLGRAGDGCAVFLPVAAGDAQRRAGRRHLELRPLQRPADGCADHPHEDPVRARADRRHPGGAAHLPGGRSAHPAAPPDDPLGDAVQHPDPACGEQPALFPLRTG